MDFSFPFAICLFTISSRCVGRLGRLFSETELKMSCLMMMKIFIKILILTFPKNDWYIHLIFEIFFNKKWTKTIIIISQKNFLCIHDDNDNHFQSSSLSLTIGLTESKEREKNWFIFPPPWLWLWWRRCLWW